MSYMIIEWIFLSLGLLDRYKEIVMSIFHFYAQQQTDNWENNQLIKVT